MLTNGKHLNFKVYLNGYAIDALQSNSHKRFLIMVLIETIWFEEKYELQHSNVHRKLSVEKIVKTDIT